MYNIIKIIFVFFEYDVNIWDNKINQLNIVQRSFTFVGLINQNMYMLKTKNKYIKKFLEKKSKNFIIFKIAVYLIHFVKVFSMTIKPFGRDYFTKFIIYFDIKKVWKVKQNFEKDFNLFKTFSFSKNFFL